MNVFRSCLFVIIALAMVTAALGQTQLGTGDITGQVLDANGAAVVGATVTLTGVATGLVKTAVTNSDGQFNFPVLQPSDYTVTVEQTGFSKLVEKVTVEVGRAATLRLQLKTGNVGEIIDVTADTLIDTTKTDESSIVNREQIDNLPINGRRADQFALLTPGVTKDGRFGLLSYHGQPGVFNNFTIEGNDDNQAYFSEARGRTRIASSISMNAIQEFQVEQTNFLPEFGRSAGGGINSVIRSGGNLVHADGFYYFRNKKFDARDPLSTVNPDEKRQQFGGSISGPIKKDRVFYFVNYDQQLRNAPLVISDTSNILTNVPNGTVLANFNAGCQALIKVIQGFPIGSPNPNLQCGAAATSNQFLTLLPRQFNQNLVLAKVDAALTPKNNLSVTYNYLTARSPEGIQTAAVLNNLGGNGHDDVRINSFNARLASTVSSTKVNEFRMQVSRDFEFESSDNSGPNVSVAGFTFGTATFLQRPANPDEKRYQFVDNFSITAGKHYVKFGGEYNRARDEINNPAFFSGAYSYSTVAAFGADVLSAAQNLGQRNYTSFSENFGLPGIIFHTTDYAAFIEDQFKASPRLTINYGLRYDYERVPDPVAPNPAFVATQKFNHDTTNFGPRIGVAYDVRGDGKTVLRGGYGVYYGRTPNGIYENALLQTGSVNPATATIALTLQSKDPGAPLFPAILPSLPAVALNAVSPFLLDPNYKRPRLQEVNFGIEREIARNLVVSASFVYDKGDRLPIQIDSNLPTPSASNTFTRFLQLPDGSSIPFSFLAVPTSIGGVAVTGGVNASRPNPTVGFINTQLSIGETHYKALLLELRRRFNNGLQFNLAYTLARSVNDAGTSDGGGTSETGPFGGGSLQNQFASLKDNEALSPLDQRNRFVFDGIYNLKKIETGNSVLNALVNDYRFSGIFIAESGRPYPSLLSVPTLSFVQGTGAAATTFTGFGGLFGQGGTSANILPNVVRNNNVGVANYRVDLRLARDIRVTERFRVELLGEGFNIFNRSNFNGFNRTAFNVVSPAGGSLSTPLTLTPVTTFGTPNADGSAPDGTNARRFQVAVRFKF